MSKAALFLLRKISGKKAPARHGEQVSHTGAAIRISQRPASLLYVVTNPTRPGGETDCHTSDIGHWFAMTRRDVSKTIFPCSQHEDSFSLYSLLQ